VKEYLPQDRAPNDRDIRKAFRDLSVDAMRYVETFPDSSTSPGVRGDWSFSGNVVAVRLTTKWVFFTTTTGVTGDQDEVTTTTVDYTVLNTDKTVYGNGTLTLTMPTAVGIAGKWFDLKNISTGKVTVAFASGETADGNTTLELYQNEAVRLKSDGSVYRVH